jgi:hypothetical protein
MEDNYQGIYSQSYELAKSSARHEQNAQFATSSESKQVLGRVDNKVKHPRNIARSVLSNHNAVS